jgi:hypothetical protein
MIEVVTVFAPRGEASNWEHYLPLLMLQKRTAEKFGHEHVVVCDRALKGFVVQPTQLPQSLMKAQIAGQVAYLERWDDSHPFVFVDADCLIARDLAPAFDGTFDIGLTIRNDVNCPVNNGAMYFNPGARAFALEFFRLALEQCEDHWGGDQEAISRVAAPAVLEPHIVARVAPTMRRHAGRIAFLSMRSHNVIPKEEGRRHKSDPFVVHFKGATKAWAKTYADRFIL